VGRLATENERLSYQIREKRMDTNAEDTIPSYRQHYKEDRDQLEE